jgi:hypothetical protein
MFVTAFYQTSNVEKYIKRNINHFIEKVSFLIFYYIICYVYILFYSENGLGGINDDKRGSARWKGWQLLL